MQGDPRFACLSFSVRSHYGLSADGMLIGNKLDVYTKYVAGSPFDVQAGAQVLRSNIMRS
jgi:hypothetical protein